MGSYKQEAKEENRLEFKYGSDLKKAILTGLGGLAVWALKEYIPPLFNNFKESFHRSISVDSDATPELFDKLEVWLERQERIYCSNYVVKNIADKNKVNLSIGYSPSLYRIQNRICLVERSSKDHKKSWQRGDKISIKILYTKNLNVVYSIMNEIYNTSISDEDNRVKVTCGYVDFYKNKRDLHTIAMNKEDKVKLVKDIEQFLESREYYQKRGIVYKRNYMIYGEPGCGKSSLIWALASFFNMNLRLVDISDISSSADLQRILAWSSNTLIVFEDIDAMGADVKPRVEEKKAGRRKAETVEDEAEHRISMSSLLNIFDGINTPDGSICIFTTNHIEKLDKAFLREGRMDFTLKMGKIGKDEIIENIAKNMLSIEEVKILQEHLSENINANPADCQSIMMKENLEGMVSKLNSYGG